LDTPSYSEIQFPSEPQKFNIAPALDSETCNS